MKLPKIHFKKSGPSTESLHKKFFDPNRLWLFALATFFFLVVVGWLISFNFFRSVYSEDYKNVGDTTSAIKEEMNIENLIRAIERREAVLNKDLPTAPDPSL